MPVRRHALTGKWIERAICVIRNVAPGLFDQNGAGSHIPDFERALPETVQATGSDIGKIEGSRTVASRALAAQQKVSPDQLILGSLRQVVRETGRQERADQRINC